MRLPDTETKDCGAVPEYPGTGAEPSPGTRNPGPTGRYNDDRGDNPKADGSEPHRRSNPGCGAPGPPGRPRWATDGHPYRRGFRFRRCPGAARLPWLRLSG